jgi:sulfite reductase (NADPH) flavoprotein alpha-component
MQPTVPFIPDNAPFTPDQRGWLNGFLAGLFSVAEVTPAPATVVPSLKIAVLYASQSGTSENLARKVAKELKAKGHVASLISLEGYTPATLASERYAVIIASTYGDGDAPDAVKPFYEQLCLEHFPRYGDLQYSVLALGDSHYEHFCKFGIDLDQKLRALGGVRICDRVDCDVDLDETFAQWQSALFHCIADIVAIRPPNNAPSVAVSTPAFVPAASTSAPIPSLHLLWTSILSPITSPASKRCTWSSRSTIPQ